MTILKFSGVAWFPPDTVQDGQEILLITHLLRARPLLESIYHLLCITVSSRANLTGGQKGYFKGVLGVLSNPVLVCTALNGKAD